MNIKRYIDILERDGISVQHSSLLGEGMDSVAILVNNTTVFRFFKKQDNRDLAAIEHKVLSYVAPHISFVIPSYTYISPSYEYVGYAYITGDVFDETEWETLLPIERATITAQIATFLAELHGCLSAEKAKEMGVQPMFGVYGHTTDTLMHSLEAIMTDIPSDLYQFFLSTIQDYSAFVSNDVVSPVILHGDLNMTNLAYNKDEKIFHGIFDWSDIAVGDPHHDFWGLFDIHDAFVTQIIDLYTKETRRVIHLEKARNFARIATIGWLMKQIQKDGFQMVDADIQRVYTWMNT